MNESKESENNNSSHSQNGKIGEKLENDFAHQEAEAVEEKLEINDFKSENRKFEESDSNTVEFNDAQSNEMQLSKEEDNLDKQSDINNLEINNSENLEEKDVAQGIEFNQEDNPKEQEQVTEENINDTIEQKENRQTQDSIEVQNEESQQDELAETKEVRRKRLKEEIKYKGIDKNKIEFIKNTEKYLLENYRFFSFFEIMNLLYYLCNIQNKDPQEAIIVEPPLKSKNILMGIIDFKIDYVYRVYTNEIAMWGVNSPAPEYFTNQIIELNELGYDGLKDFLTLFQNELSHLHYKIQLTQYPAMKAVQDKSSDIQDYLLSLMKVDKNNVDPTINPYSILEFIDIFLFNKRNYINLTLLCNRLAKKSNVKVTLDQFYSREYKIESDDYTRLDKKHSQLGYDTVLGNRIKSNSKSILFAFNFENYQKLEDFMNPDNKYSFYYFRNVVTLYLGFNFLFEFEFIIDKIQVNTLGECFKLGFNSWIIQDSQQNENIHKDSIKELF